jgi:multidrug efflux pump
VRLTDVATLVDGAENLRLAAWADRSDAVIINVQRQPGANVIEVADKVGKLLPQLTASLPASLDCGSSTTAPPPSAPRCATCSTSC